MNTTSEYSLTDEQIEKFNTDGVICLRGVLKTKHISCLRNDVASIMSRSGEQDTGYDFERLRHQVWRGDMLTSTDRNERFDLDMYQLALDTDPEARPIADDVAETNKGQFYYDAGLWRFYKGIRETAFRSALPQISAELLASDYINFWEDTTFVKTPQTSQRTTFHQDWGYFQISGEKCCIVWIPLDPVDHTNGAMEYIRGSHLWGMNYAPNLLVSQTIDPTSPYEKLPDIEGNMADYDIVSFDVDPGDVIIHHVKTVHGSSGNTSSDKMRRAMAFRYCGDDITYFEKPGAIEQPYIDKKLSNGDRLNSVDYPLVYGEML